LFVGVTSDGSARVILSFCGEDLELGEDFFIWPHLMNSSEALFMVDGVVERATREATSQSHEGVQETLSRMGDTIVMVAQLSMEAQC
jgi:hypothetical protein